MRNHRLPALLLSLLLASTSLMLTGCPTPPPTDDPDEGVAVPVTVRVVSLKGPTSIGLVDFIDAAGGIPQSVLHPGGATPGGSGTDGTTQNGDQSGASQGDGDGLEGDPDDTEDGDQTPEDGAAPSNTPFNDYKFNIVATVDEILPGFITGRYDIALLPANIAAVLYQRTEGGIQVIDINTLGVLYVVSADDSILSLDDLSGRTVLMTGKGTTPEYVMNALLAYAEITDVKLEYRSEATELAAMLAADPRRIAVLPEPYVTALLAKDPRLSIRISLTESWNALAIDGSQLVTGVTVVRKAFAEQYPEVLAEFISLRSASVETVVADPIHAGKLVAALGIIGDAAVAAHAIPQCNLVCITGDEMRLALDGYLKALFDQNPASVGGTLPDSDFYYA
ncbi:MAG: ABC transporter substrate-binding protein [Coriobacteriia bacterium]|nr:ABC transporter substrate-binding protein [Coriobacteriia bacterium]